MLYQYVTPGKILQLFLDVGCMKQFKVHETRPPAESHELRVLIFIIYIHKYIRREITHM